MKKKTDFNLHSDWIQSFSVGEGNFNFLLKDNNSASVRFTVSQNVHGYFLMKLFVKFFGKGKIYPLDVNDSFESIFNFYKDRKEKGLNSVIYFGILSKKDNKEKIIPFFEKYPLFSIKQLDFLDWTKLIKMSNNKEYLKKEGKEEMLSIIKKNE